MTTELSVEHGNRVVERDERGIVVSDKVQLRSHVRLLFEYLSEALLRFTIWPHRAIPGYKLATRRPPTTSR